MTCVMLSRRPDVEYSSTRRLVRSSKPFACITLKIRWTNLTEKEIFASFSPGEKHTALWKICLRANLKAMLEIWMYICKCTCLHACEYTHRDVICVLRTEEHFTLYLCYFNTFLWKPKTFFCRSFHNGWTRRCLKSNLYRELEGSKC